MLSNPYNMISQMFTTQTVVCISTNLLTNCQVIMLGLVMFKNKNMHKKL